MTVRWVILTAIAVPVLGVLGFCAWAEHRLRADARSPYRPRYTVEEE